MSSVNKVMLIGNLGKDPEVRYVMDNVPVATFSIATTESYKDKSGEWQEATDWHNVVAWRQLAERVEKYFKKGSQVYVEGKLRTRSYDDKDGNKRYVTEVVADNVFTLGRREGGDNGSRQDSIPSGYEQQPSTHAQGSKSSSGSVNDVPIDDDLPF